MGTTYQTSPRMAEFVIKLHPAEVKGFIIGSYIENFTTDELRQMSEAINMKLNHMENNHVPAKA